MKHKILHYYNNLAKTYDENRFENSYGSYIDQQERNFLNSFFKDKNFKKILDLGCGTGRLLNFATHGLDFSEEMISVAKGKFKNKIVEIGEISKIPFEVKFDYIFCFHVIMHQSLEETENFLSECSDHLNENGILIFDYPTSFRRRAISEQEDWHANNTFDEEKISELLKNKWEILQSTGVLLFPIQRIPTKMRRFFLSLDQFLCRTFIKKWASYNIVVLKKR